MKARERKAGCDADGGLLHDPEVDGAARIVPQRGREQVDADVRQHEGEPLVLAEELDHRGRGALPHRFCSTTATTAVGE